MILSFKETKELLKELPLLETEIVLNEDKLIEAAFRIGFPLVLKVSSKDVLHRTDLGLVEKNIQNIQQAREAFFRLGKKAENISFEGFLVQKQMEGVELFCGLKRDKSFGPVLMFGLGGFWVEVLKDIVVGICPLSANEALEIVRSIKGHKVLEGFRNMEKVDENSLVKVLSRLSTLLFENSKIKEADFNPITCKGRDIFIVDAKLII